MVSRLEALYAEQGQSPWLDNLKRTWIADGELARWVERGVRGITSNPTIFQKAIEATDAYDDQFRSLVRSGSSVEEAYWDLVVTDITAALEILLPVHEASEGLDGFVSVEVAPALAHDTAATADAAFRLHERIARPNLYVKIPGTAEGLPAIQQVLSGGGSVNVTLLFSLERYGEVIEAYLKGLEDCDAELSSVSSVASFFVSRVDSEVDRRLTEIGSSEALALRGQAAVANARLAYRLFTERFSGERWDALARRGARVQRPLWASTSTKDPSYPDTLYVDELIGPDTINTMPDATLDAFADHGTVARKVDRPERDPQEVFDSLAHVGVDIDDVTRTLEREGVESFVASFDDLLESLSAKAEALAS